MSEDLGRRAPFRHAGFRWFFAATSVNSAGSNMAGVALAFAVLGIGSARDLGLVLAAGTVPTVLLMLFGGVAATRLPVLLVLRAGLLLLGCLQLAAAVLVISGTAHVWMLVCLEAAGGVVMAMTYPALASMVPRLVPPHLLQQANVWQQMSRSAMRVIGPTIGALVVVAAGAGWALALDAATWLVAAALMTRVSVAPREPDAAGPEQTTVLEDLRDGWGYVRRTTWLWVAVLAMGVVNAIQAGAWYTLGPGRAKATIGEQGWGLVLSAEAIGLLVAATLLARRRISRPLASGMACVAMVGVPIFVLGLHPSLPVLVVIAALAGAGTQVFSLGWALAMQEHVPQDMLARAYSYDAVGSFAAMPVGQLLAGHLAGVYGVRQVMMVGGAAYVAICLLTLASASVRGLRRTPAEAVGVAA